MNAEEQLAQDIEDERVLWSLNGGTLGDCRHPMYLRREPWPRGPSWPWDLSKEFRCLVCELVVLYIGGAS